MSHNQATHFKRTISCLLCISLLFHITCLSTTTPDLVWLCKNYICKTKLTSFLQNSYIELCHCTGVYADESDVKKCLSEKYGTLLVTQLKEKEVNGDLMESDICMTIRLQIVYGRLSIRSVRNAFEESVGNRLNKFGGSDNKELLQRYVILLINFHRVCINQNNNWRNFFGYYEIPYTWRDLHLGVFSFCHLLVFVVYRFLNKS